MQAQWNSNLPSLRVSVGRGGPTGDLAWLRARLTFYFFNRQQLAVFVYAMGATEPVECRHVAGGPLDARILLHYLPRYRRSGILLTCAPTHAQLLSLPTIS